MKVATANGDWRDVPLERETQGYYSAAVPNTGAGDRYFYRLDDRDVPDPASRFQPDGPFGPSQVIDPATYTWSDSAWTGIMLRGQVIYELHLGTFTTEGTWRAAADRLPQLADVGITTLEIMPLSDFPGRFGWGYDGVFPYAPSRLYGTPDDVRAFIDRAHALGIAVIHDVVYNHLGPDGCVFGQYADSYFAKKYGNEWGDGMNFDGDDAAAVREFFIANAGYWIEEFHFDGLRLDATQSIHDASPVHVIADIATEARRSANNRSIIIVTENEPQDVRMLKPTGEGGYGLDAAWNDDFHHSAVVLLTGHKEAYYTDHRGTPQEFISAAKYGYLFQGEWYSWQKQPRGTDTRRIAPAAFVTFIENHDQLANSGDGSRLRQRTTPGQYRAMTALMLLMPGTPMLFQGQEFGATTPFLYFADHKPELAQEVLKGRAEFVTQFQSLASPEMQARVAPPHELDTFERCRLDWQERESNVQCVNLHRDLLTMRRTHVAFASQAKGALDGAVLSAEAFLLRFDAVNPDDERLLLVNFGRDVVAASFAEPLLAPPTGRRWHMSWSSESPEYGGSGTPDPFQAGWRLPGHSALVLTPEPPDVDPRAQ